MDTDELSEAGTSAEVTMSFVYSCERGHTVIVSLSLKDLLIDERENHGKTRFILACEGGCIRILSSLLQDPQKEINKYNAIGLTGVQISVKESAWSSSSSSS